MAYRDDVLVVDAHEQFVGYVHWAVARRAIREKLAYMSKRHPPTIRLPPGVLKLPTEAFLDAEKGKKMHNANGYPTNNNAPQSVTNWFKFFQEERELWVQNISATQLSIQFEVAPGHYAGVLIPIGPDPLCITNEVPFDSVKKSLDFRKFLNRVPSVMKLLTTEQAHQYYADKAKNLGAYLTDPETGKLVPNVAAAIEHTDLERKKLTTRPTGDDTIVGPDGQVRFSPPKTALELMNMNAEQHMGVNPMAAAAAGVPVQGQQYPGPSGFANAPGFIQQAQAAAQAGGPSYGTPGFSPQAAGFANVGQQPVMMEQLIHPRVLYLCQQVSMQLQPNLRMPADQFWRELRALQPQLNLESLQYIESNGTYKTVKKWARELQQTLVAQGQDESVEDGLDEASVTPIGAV